MRISVGFADQKIVFSDTAPASGRGIAVLAGGDLFPIAKMLQIVGNSKEAYRISPDPEREFQQFARQFRRVDAAGGWVADAGGHVLMIYRNDRWDLPKGHVEEGETDGACALREVAEETGLREVRLEEPLTDTYHFYLLRGVWELKRTRWFRMTHPDVRPVVQPQSAEGITSVEWLGPEELPGKIAGSYATIREVFRAVAGNPG